MRKNLSGGVRSLFTIMACQRTPFSYFFFRSLSNVGNFTPNKLSVAPLLAGRSLWTATTPPTHELQEQKRQTSSIPEKFLKQLETSVVNVQQALKNIIDHNQYNTNKKSNEASFLETMYRLKEIDPKEELVKANAFLLKLSEVIKNENTQKIFSLIYGFRSSILFDMITPLFPQYFLTEYRKISKIVNLSSAATETRKNHPDNSRTVELFLEFMEEKYRSEPQSKDRTTFPGLRNGG